MRRFFTLLTFIFICHSGFSQVWVAKPINPSTTSGRTRNTSFFINGTAYTVGGSDNCCYYPAPVYAYDTLTETWTQKTSTYPDASAADGKVVAVINGIAYVGLGVGPGINWQNTFFSYDPTSDTWTSLMAFPGSARAYSTAFAVGGKMYVAGGTNGNNNVGMKDFYVYDPVGNSWQQLNDCPARGINEFASTFTINDTAFVGCGDSVSTSGYVSFSDFWRYNPSNDTWTRRADVPGGTRTEAMNFALCDRGYIGGGYSITGGVATDIGYSDFYQYNPATDSWKRIADYGGGKSNGGSWFVAGNTGYIYGGQLKTAGNSNNRWIDSLWSYTPIPGFSAISNICAGQSITFTDTTTFLPNSWSWSFPGGTPDTSNSPNPTVTYNSAGVYDVVLTASIGAGCLTASKRFSQYVTVGTASGVLNIVPKSPAICPGQSVTLSVPGGNSTLTWSPGTGLNTTTGDTVIVTPTSTLAYTVSSSGGCGSLPGTDTITLNTVTPFVVQPSAPALCTGDTVILTVTGASVVNWNPSTGLNKAIGDTVVASAPVDSVTYILTGTDLSGCADTGMVKVRLGGSSIAGKVQAIRDTICQGSPGNLTLVGNSSNTIQWQLSTDGINFTDINGVVDTTKYKTSPLSTSTWYRATVGSGICVAESDTLQLYVPPALIAYFKYTQTSSNELVFNSDSSLGKIRSYHWDFGDGQTSNDSNPSHTYINADSTYYVCLTLYDGSNCSYTFCRYSQLADAIPTISGAGNWLIYPNPFSEQLIITGRQTGSSLKSIEMFDVLGQLVINKDIDNATNTSIQLNVSSLAKGMYYLMIKTADVNYVQKVVKQ